MGEEACLIANIRATTFNAAGLHPKTIAMHGENFDNAESLIDSYYVKGEIVTHLQEQFVMQANMHKQVPVHEYLPDAVGKRIGINSYKPFSSRIARHGIQHMIRSLQQ